MGAGPKEMGKTSNSTTHHDTLHSYMGFLNQLFALTFMIFQPLLVIFFKQNIKLFVLAGTVLIGKSKKDADRERL